MEMLGSELLVKALLAEGVDTLFAYPGGQAIDLFHALYGVQGLNVVLPRHEQGLIHAADGYARSTGKVGVCLVTSGPGATNLVTGIATANFDSVPLVCFTGQVPTSSIGNDAFQEVDIVGITRNICKYAVTVRKREDLGPIIKKAFTLARTGRAWWWSICPRISSRRGGMTGIRIRFGSAATNRILPFTLGR